ncbi:cytochrome P450 [Jiella marina]|uniref:cytochrome P450 n=1 Tax=Jiella sp. LLJ827 TaxID=2917712 RepID=UPI002100AA5A|nr:cytochrome P450 [Jiella sp. LLJ827]MCQ0990281.1 cytochrome P450 [Jiella sp. LLJ827]
MAAFEPVKLDVMPEGSKRLTFINRLLRNPASAAPAELLKTPVFAPPFAKGRLVYVADPEALETIFVERPEDFPKGPIDNRILRPIFRDGLLLAEGADWRWKRRLAAPVFSPAAMRRFMPQIVAPFRELALEWQAAGGRVDASDGMKSATLSVIDRLLFAGRREIDPELIKRHVDDYLAPTSWMVAYSLFGISEKLPFPGRRKLENARDAVQAVLAEFVARRRADDGGVDDLCNRLLAASDPKSGRRLTDEDTVDMLLTLMSAGHETSANALAWAIYCLVEMPEVQECLIAEIDAAVGDRPIEHADIEKLGTVRAFIEETMRLFPPAPGLSRRMVKAETFGGMRFEPDTAVLIPIYLIHRHPAFWDRPDVFDLDRFTNGKDAGIQRTVYMPFGAGPKICLGAQLALVEMTAGLATLLQHVRFSRAADEQPRPLHRVTLRPAENFQAVALPRRHEGSFEDAGPSAEAAA